MRIVIKQVILMYRGRRLLQQNKVVLYYVSAGIPTGRTILKRILYKWVKIIWDVTFRRILLPLSSGYKIELSGESGIWNGGPETE
jgi:hypothetical protein